MKIVNFTTKEAQAKMKSFLDELEKGNAVIIRKMMIKRVDIIDKKYNSSMNEQNILEPEDIPIIGTSKKGALISKSDGTVDDVRKGLPVCSSCKRSFSTLKNIKGEPTCYECCTGGFYGYPDI